VALRGDGTVWAWGLNTSGQLGNGTTTNSSAPVEVPLGNVVAIAAGGDNSYALLRNGSLYAWGDNTYGQLGNTTAGKQSTTPVQVSVSGITAIAAGYYHALAIDKNQTVWAWGRNNSDQLGDGQACSTRYCTTPTHLATPTGVIALAGGTQHSLAATTKATVTAWGDDSYGELGNGTTSKKPLTVQTSGLATIIPGAQPTFTYGGDGLRATKTSAGQQYNYAWDNITGTDPLLLTDGATNYIYGPNDTPIEQISPTGTVTYLHTDRNGSTRLLTNSAGAVAGTYSYDPWGNTAAHVGAGTTNLQYQGQYLDPESGFYYLRARYYDPQTAQFATRDSLQQLSQQPYDYAVNDPLNAADPRGLDPFSDFVNAVGTGVSWAWNHPVIVLGVVAAGTGIGALAGASFVVGGFAVSETGLGVVSAGTAALGTSIDGVTCVENPSVAGCVAAGAGVVSAGLASASGILLKTRPTLATIFGAEGVSSGGLSGSLDACTVLNGNENAAP
jgi:RHS repeat-associated protein